MRVLEDRIVVFENTSVFIYDKDNNVKVQPTEVTFGNSLVTTIKKKSLTKTDPDDDIVVELPSKEDSINEFKHRGFTYKDKDSQNFQDIMWHIESATIQVFLNHGQGTKLTLDHPDLLTYMTSVGIPVLHEDDGVYIYLTELYPEHRTIFEQYKAKITEKPAEAEILTDI